jgi:flavodoxin
MKTLIVYYSFSGNNECLAKELQKRLNCDIQKIVEMKPRKSLDILLDLIFKRESQIEKSDFDLRQYDRSILTAPIWAGKIATPLRAFIELAQANFKEYLFITVCTGSDGQEAKIADELVRLIQKKPKIVMQLQINDLLPSERKQKVKHLLCVELINECYLLLSQKYTDYHKIYKSEYKSQLKKYTSNE